MEREPEPKKRKVRLKTKPAGQMALEGMGLIERVPRPEPLPDRAWDHFWEAYPRKVDKYQARLQWEKLKKDRTVKADDILRGLEAQLPVLANRGPFVPHPDTWLRNHRWLDQVNHIDPQPPTEAEKLYAAAIQRYFKEGKL